MRAALSVPWLRACPQCPHPDRTADPRTTGTAATRAAHPRRRQRGRRRDPCGLVQGTWVDSSRGIDNPRAYLYRLAINLATDHGRESTRRNRLLAEHYLWQEDEQISTEEQVMAQDELQRVLDAAGHLPEPTRTIFHLNRLQGLAS